jgi:hypothetical protein
VQSRPGEWDVRLTLVVKARATTWTSRMKLDSPEAAIGLQADRHDSGWRHARRVELEARRSRVRSCHRICSKIAR